MEAKQKMMSKEILVFKKGSTAIHRLSPKTKIYFVIVFTILGLLRLDLPYITTIFILSLIPIPIAKMSREWLRSIKPLTTFIVIVFAFNYIFTFNLILSLSIVFRLLILVNVFMVFMKTTMPDDLAQSLYELGLPHDFVLAFTMSLRFVPTIMRDAQIIIDAQRARGLETEKGNPIKRARNYLPVLIPLIVNAIRRAKNVAEAMESRGFGATEKPTPLYKIKFKTFDWLVILMLSFLLMVTLAITYAPHIFTLL